ncbi:MAG: hypothetical protein Q7R85_00915 [bacterium]|nr:hypothetical protein [bacterium]
MLGSYTPAEMIQACLCHTGLGAWIAVFVTVATIVMLRWAWKRAAPVETVIALTEEGRTREYYAQCVKHVAIMALLGGLAGNAVDIDHIIAKLLFPWYTCGRLLHTAGFHIGAFFLVVIYARLAAFVMGGVLAHFRWSPIASIGDGIIGLAAHGWDIKDPRFLWKFTTYYTWRTVAAWVVVTHVLEDYAWNLF